MPDVALSLKGCPLQGGTARRQEAGLTTGSLAWNRMPTTFQRIRSAKQQRSVEMTAAFGPKSPRSPCGPELHLQPHQSGGGKSPVICLGRESGCVRPKTANFPARNFLSGYRQMALSRASARNPESGASSRSSFLVGMGNPTGSAQPDLDQMNEEDLRAIFEELARSGEEETATEKQKKQPKVVQKPKIAGFDLPATELQSPTSEAASSSPFKSPSDPVASGEEVADSYQTGRVTPIYRLRPQSRATHSAKSIGPGKILQSNDNMVYVPKLKTRYCRIYVGSNVAKPRMDSEEYEFLPMNQRAPLHDHHEKHERRGYYTRSRQPPVVYSSNFFTAFDHDGKDVYGHHTPEGPDMDCIMCQHLLRTS